MDTVGDAYVVAGLLPADPVEDMLEDEASSKHAEITEGVVCRSMLEVTLGEGRGVCESSHQVQG